MRRRRISGSQFTMWYSLLFLLSQQKKVESIMYDVVSNIKEKYILY